MKKSLLLLSMLFYVMSIGAIKSEKDLDALYAGMPLKDVVHLFGEAKYSKYDKESKIRMLLYDFYRIESGFNEYHLYFKDDKLAYLMQSVDKMEVPRSIKGGDYTLIDINPENKKNSINQNKAYTIEGKSIVVAKVIENISLNNEQLVNAVVAAIYRACNGSQGELKMKESTRVLYHGIIDRVVTFDGRWGSINVVYTIDVAIKQGRVRVKVIGEEIDWHQDYDKATYYFVETFPIGTISMKDVPAVAAQELVRNTIKTFYQYISVIEEELNQMVEDDW